MSPTHHLCTTEQPPRATSSFKLKLLTALKCRGLILMDPTATHSERVFNPEVPHVPRVSYLAKSSLGSRSRPFLQLETSSFGCESPSYMFIFGPKTVKIGDGHPWRPFWTKVLLTSELPNGPRVRPHERGTSFLRPKLLTPLKCHQGPHCNSLQMSFHPRGASCSWSLILSENSPRE